MTMLEGVVSYEEKQQRRANSLCLYCGHIGHITMNSPHIKLYIPRSLKPVVTRICNPVSNMSGITNNLNQRGWVWFGSLMSECCHLQHMLSQVSVLRVCVRGCANTHTHTHTHTICLFVCVYL